MPHAICKPSRSHTNACLGNNLSNLVQNVVKMAELNDVKFIESVRKHECLHDTGRRDYRDIRKEENAWRDISESLNLAGRPTFLLVN